jgi:hypothetical protein
MKGQSRAENAELLTQAGLTLAMSHGQLAELLGSSRRSVSRWVAEGTWLVGDQATTLARAVHRGNRPLAARFAALAGRTLPELGLDASSPVSAAPTTKLLDAVVCAAAEAMDASPRAVRPALLAAVRCAREVGLTLETMEELLDSQRAASASATRAGTTSDAKRSRG